MKSKRNRAGSGGWVAAGQVLQRLIEDDVICQVSWKEYQSRVRALYGGPQGAVLHALSALSLHTPLGERLIRERRFEIRGARRLLDVGSGAGQIARHLVKYADPQTRITCFDLSIEMVKRARDRLKSRRPHHAVADVTRLPFPDASFDCVTCGYVLEHLPSAKTGLAEIARVMSPGGRMLLLTSEDTLSGAMTSRLWQCRTYNRREIRREAEAAGFRWVKDLWFSKLHEAFRAGGIGAELERT